MATPRVIGNMDDSQDNDSVDKDKLDGITNKMNCIGAATSYLTCRWFSSIIPLF